MDYKKIIKSRKVRLKILKALSFIPDRPMIEFQYHLHNGIKLNLKDPQRYTEKLQWYKLYYRDPVMRQCVDKYGVREYVKSKGLEDILVPEYGCYDSTDEIKWDSLPEQFVLKLTNGAGGLNCLFCEDKEKLNYADAKKVLDGWIETSGKISPGREWAYDGLKPRIICDGLLRPSDQLGAGLDDYKFFCFNGKTVLKWVDYDRYVKHKRVLFTPEGERLDVRCTHESPKDFPYPAEAFEAMQPIVDTLAADFPHVRVDLYYTDHRVYFGELTFYSGGGYEPFDPDAFDFELGEKWILPKKRI